MKIGLISDLHAEFWKSERLLQTIADKCNDSAADVIVNAGDIFIADNRKTHEFFKSLLKKPYHFIPGNHDFYYGSFENRQEIVMLGDTKMAMTTLWTNFRGIDPDEADRIYGFIADRKCIDGGDHASILQKAFDENLEFIKRQQPDVIISHFMPFLKSIAPQYQNETSNLNYYFCNDMSDFVSKLEKKPRIWACGHTHWAHTYDEQGIKVYCNPLGYPRENFNALTVHHYAPLIIEV